MGFDIVGPKAMALTVGVVGVVGADALDFRHHFTIIQGGASEILPILPLAARNRIVDGGQREPFVIEMAVQHEYFPKIRPVAETLTIA